MAKKKSKNKKHSFKYAEPTTATPAQSASGPAARPATPNRAAAPVAAMRDFSYLPGDLRRLALFAGGLVLVELVLWYLFAHTGLGPAVDGLVKV